VAFWQRRDAEPQLPGNAERDAFFRGVRYANDRYSTMRVDGWETDRGRVIIRYGVPSQIEPRLFNRDLAPHEIWEYNNIPGEGQAIFVFADLDGFGEFRLIHSSVTGEIKSMNWQSEIVR
jgi:GWxTD domain-containing protein